MKEKFEALKVWVGENKVIAAVVGFIILALIARKFMKRSVRRRSTRRKPFSVVRSASRSRSFNRIIKSGSNRGKKAWQIKGSPEARRHMAAIRRKRRA